ncbi:hypothetical protein MMC13_003467 [Lambiella insularis]|nr:hypothetical protein [Lambiella insularis]
MYHQSSSENGQARDQVFDVDAMLFDVSNRMARAQLARQISSSSSTFRERAARVLKPSSVGNSPQKLQRRRTVTSNMTSKRRSELYNQSVQVPYSAVDGHTSHQSWASSTSNARPVSWHPTSMGVNRSCARMTSARTSSYEPQSRQSMAGPRNAVVGSRGSMAGYQTVAMNGLPTPMTQPDLNTEYPVDPFFSLDGSSLTYQQSIPEQSIARQSIPHQLMSHQSLPEQSMPYPQAYNSAGLSLNTTYQSYMPTDASYQLQLPSVPTSSAYSCTPMNYATQSWAESLSAFPAYTAPPTPDFLPIQNPLDMWQGATTAVQPRLMKPRSKELVGMGLYDSPDDRNSFSMDSAIESHIGSFVTDPHHESLGKGLKLEETWVPPAESDEEEESESSEEQEDVQAEDPISAVADVEQMWQMDAGSIMAGKAQEALQSTQEDMSNQSFFFDNDDNYYEGGAFGQDVQMQSNLQGVVLKDFMWV